MLLDPVRLLCELIALPSVNPAFVPPDHPRAGEADVGDFLLATAGKAGLDVDRQEVMPKRYNTMVSLAPKARARQRVLLAPHLDTVGAAEEGFVPAIKAGRIYGRGACDTKGSVAAMMAALTAVANSPTRPRETEILLVGMVDEENTQQGSRAFVASGLQARFAIVGEPTRLEVVSAHKGSLWLNISAKGKAAHGAMPHLGVNAVHTGARVVALLEEKYRRILNGRSHPLLGPPTVNVGAINGGSQPNIVPDACEVQVDRRTLPGETEARVRRELNRLFREAGLRVMITDRKRVPCEPLDTDPSLPWVQALLRSARKERTIGVHYFCDASVLSAGGIPSVVFGPGDIAQAHTTNEWISRRSLENATLMLTEFLSQLP